MNDSLRNLKKWSSEEIATFPMNAAAQRMNCGYRLAVWLTQWRRDGKSESKTYLWSALRGRYTRNESEASVDVVATCQPQFRAADFAGSARREGVQ
ncbi:hypothetical protein PQR05_09515 [Paraburkholderia sediminicola]|uniref:Uncharacterized protein n=1 Tax=Paraburkholderia metrosideri TaxID=580937 RepID=A0ABW9DNK7_9BURK